MDFYEIINAVNLYEKRVFNEHENVYFRVVMKNILQALINNIIILDRLAFKKICELKTIRANYEF